MDLPQPLGFSHPSLNPFYSFAVTKVCVLSSIWMISWSLFALSGQVKGTLVFVFLVGPSWSTYQFFKSDLHLSQSFTFLGLCWDTVHMSVSLPPDKLADIQQLALSLLHTPHVTVRKVMSFLGKANFCINGHSQLRQLCRVIQSDMLSVYHSPTHCFLMFIFLLHPYINWTSWLTCNKVLFHCNSHFRMWSLLLMLHPLVGPFIFRDLGFLYPLVVHGLVPCLGLILPCRNFSLLQSWSVGWPSALW